MIHHLRASGAAGLLLTTFGFAAEPGDVEPLHDAAALHCDQLEMLAIPDPHDRFDEAFECGDELFATRFNILDGVGANVGKNLRFTRVPRADLVGPEEWAFHEPARTTGPNAEACTDCHNEPFEDGAGGAGLNVIRDPSHSGNPALFIQRNTPHLFGAGALQRLAEEMTAAIREAVDAARSESCRLGAPVPLALEPKGVDYGTVVIRCSGGDDLSGLEGIDDDLVVKPFQWKGNTATVRQFNREASHRELGMQPVELIGYDYDGDGDDVTNEMSVGDMTAMAVYVAAQPRPTSKLELARLGLLDLTREETARIRRGADVFRDTGCADCHRPQLVLQDPQFTEPSRTPEFMEFVFPSGHAPAAESVDPADPVQFNLARDLPDNVIEVRGREVHFGSFERTRSGGARVRLYGDLKRHDMGSRLAESTDETGVGASVWITKELWGVGSTAPYLHDGRATTLTEAILFHGGDAMSSRDAFVGLDERDAAAMIAFLDNLVLYKVEEEEEAAGNGRGLDQRRQRPRR